MKRDCDKTIGLNTLIISHSFNISEAVPLDKD